MTEDAPTDRTQSESQELTAALSKELSEFLLEFSIGVHRYAMYPSDHPSLVPASDHVMRRLGGILSERRSLSIGVAHDRLIIEGLATESKHPVLSDLAKRLHDHQLGAVAFTRGVVGKEVQDVLETLAQDPERDGEPLGLLPIEEIPSWGHITLYPVGYEKLELIEDDEETEITPERSTDLWIGLARSAMGGDEEVDPEAPPDAAAVARSIRAHGREAAYDQVIVGYLLQLAEELKAGRGREAETIRRRVSGLVRELDMPTLERLVDMGGSTQQRRSFVLDANQSLAVDAVLKIVQAASEVSEQSISHSLTRLLAKLSAHAEAGPEPVRDPADAALRDNVEELLKDWELTDPNPDAYTLILDSMATAAPVFEVDQDQGQDNVSGARRLIHMSFEVDSWGPTVEKAVIEMMEAGEIEYLLKLSRQAPAGSVVGEEITDFITAPPQLYRLLSGEDIEEETLETVVGRTGTAAIPVLLDVLTESEARAIRRKVFDVLVGFEEEVGPHILDRLDEPRWYVVRNMLALVNRLPHVPEGFSSGTFLEHEDARVRREAFALAVKDSSQRERALALGFVDPDDRLLRMALLQARESLPNSLLPTLVSRVVLSNRDEELKAIGVKALADSKSSLALDALIKISSAGRTFFGRTKLSPPTPDVLAAIQVLADAWADDQRAFPILKVARKARDPKVRAALSGEEVVG